MPAGGQSYAVEALGLGDQLKQQVGEDTEEIRKKKMLQRQQVVQVGNSLAAASLFGTGTGAQF